MAMVAVWTRTLSGSAGYLATRPTRSDAIPPIGNAGGTMVVGDEGYRPFVPAQTIIGVRYPKWWWLNHRSPFTKSRRDSTR